MQYYFLFFIIVTSLGTLGQNFEGKLVYESSIQVLDTELKEQESVNVLEIMKSKGIVFDSIVLYIDSSLGYIKCIPSLGTKSLYLVSDTMIYSTGMDENNLIIGIPSTYGNFKNLAPKPSVKDSLIRGIQYRVVTCDYGGGISYTYYQIKDSLLFRKELLEFHELEGLSNIYSENWSLPVMYEIELANYFKVKYVLISSDIIPIENDSFAAPDKRLKNKKVGAHPLGKVFKAPKSWLCGPCLSNVNDG